MYRVKDRKNRVDGALADLGLADRSGQLAGTLSGGWKQRLALAACLIHDPKLLLLDEPTAGVDPKARRDFWDEIRRLSKAGVTVLVSTHYMDEAIQCDFITYIAYGKKLIDGRATEIPTTVGLKTWRAEGPELVALEDALQGEPGVEQVARFGSALHVSGTDGAALAATVAKYQTNKNQRWSEVPAGLEEAFIYLMAGARDNFSRDAT
jgi:ABC-2 type transport system ATP-binding protein